MNKNSMLKLAKSINCTELAGEKVMIDFESGKYFLLKGVANDIWDFLENPITVSEIINKLLAEYEIDEATCSESVFTFLQQLLEYNFVEVTD